MITVKKVKMNMTRVTFIQVTTIMIRMKRITMKKMNKDTT